MTSIKAVLERAFAPIIVEEDDGARLTLEPTTAEEAAECLKAASRHGWTVLLRGAGLHQGFGHRVDADVVVGTRRLGRIVTVVPDDLVAVVEAGVTLAALEGELGRHGLSAVLPEDAPGATVGGVIAAGISGWRRLRYGPTRDRVLEVVVATGDGRVVRGGGRVVKNVSGYDLPRLLTGSFGALGLITQVALKLWPVGTRQALVPVDDPSAALQRAHRPLAVLQWNSGSAVYLSGGTAELEAQAAALGGPLMPLEWPRLTPSEFRFRLRVPPAAVGAAVARVAPDWDYVAAHGVGEVRLTRDSGPDPGDVLALREWARAEGGSLVVEKAPLDWSAEIDPWGAPPSSLELQRRVKEAFDPAGVVNRGRLPGNL